jgi:hypothetical protein
VNENDLQRTCTSMALQWPEQMNISLTITSQLASSIEINSWLRLSTVRRVPLRSQFIQVLTVPTMLLPFADRTRLPFTMQYPIIWLNITDGQCYWLSKTPQNIILWTKNKSRSIRITKRINHYNFIEKNKIKIRLH